MKALGVHPSDLKELNTADHRGIDTAREIRDLMCIKGIQGGKRGWILDEVHSLTKDAQEAMLKILEEPKDHVHFVLCTTNPQKLLKTILSRCSIVPLHPVSEDLLKALVTLVGTKEGLSLSNSVIERIAECSNGSPREAMVHLQQVMSMKTEQEQLDAVQPEKAVQDAIEIVRALMRKDARWPDVASLIRKIEVPEPESFRHLVLSYATKVLLGGRDTDRVFRIIQAFQHHWYDCKESGLASSCYEALQ
jgi:DNA polymerase-3 subunit gamma/tau